MKDIKIIFGHALKKSFLGRELTKQQLQHIILGYDPGILRKIGIKESFSLEMRKLNEFIELLPDGRLDKSRIRSLATIINTDIQDKSSETARIYRCVSQELDLDSKSTLLLTFSYFALLLFFIQQPFSIATLFFSVKFNDFIVSEFLKNFSNFSINKNHSKTNYSNNNSSQNDTKHVSNDINDKKGALTHKNSERSLLLGLALQTGLGFMWNSPGLFILGYLFALFSQFLMRQINERLESIRCIDKTKEKHPLLFSFMKKCIVDDCGILLGIAFASIISFPFFIII